MVILYLGVSLPVVIDRAAHGVPFMHICADRSENSSVGFTLHQSRGRLHGCQGGAVEGGRSPIWMWPGPGHDLCPKGRGMRIAVACKARATAMAVVRIRNAADPLKTVPTAAR